MLSISFFLLLGIPFLNGFGPVPFTVDISLGQEDTSWISAAAHNNMGSYLASGDFNGDGVQDLLTGTSEGPQYTEVYVYCGRRTIPHFIDFQSVQPDVMLIERDLGDSMGYSVAAGDVNGDGFDDIIIGAPFGCGPNNDCSTMLEAGEVYIIYGSPSLPKQIDLRTQNPDVIIYGPGPLRDMGLDIKTADTNNDGIEDLLISSWEKFAPFRSLLYIVYGSKSLPPVTDLAIPGTASVIYGPADVATNLFVIGTGDFNGDGFTDIFLGSPSPTLPS